MTVPVRSTHTNLIAPDWRRLARFYSTAYNDGVDHPTVGRRCGTPRLLVATSFQAAPGASIGCLAETAGAIVSLLQA